VTCDRSTKKSDKKSQGALLSGTFKYFMTMQR
jgi:hypothetical protein